MISNNIDYMNLHSKAVKIRLKALKRCIGQYNAAISKENRDQVIENELRAEIQSVAGMLDSHIVELLMLRRELMQELNKEYRLTL